MAGHGSEQNSWSCQLAMATTFQEAHCVTGGTPMLTNTVRGVVKNELVKWPFVMGIKCYAAS